MTTTTSTPLCTTSLVKNFPVEWQVATRHPFLAAVADASLPADRFNTWLIQDYLFVCGLLSLQAHLLARAPRDAQAVLSGGLVGLDAELSWFEAHAARRGLALDARRQATTADYLALLEELQAAPYPTTIVGLWTIERAYLDAWQGALPCAPAYREFVEHWTAPAFADYVARLGQAADLSLLGAGAEIWSGARVAFLNVARIEGEFWHMAWLETAP